MSLLVIDQSVNELAKKVYERHFEVDPHLHNEYDNRQKRLMYSDILYNLSFLDTAMKFDDNRIFRDYAVWVYQLLCAVMKNLSRERIKEHMLTHYQVLQEALVEALPEAEYQKACHHIGNAIRATEQEYAQPSSPSRFQNPRFLDIKKNYLACVLRNDTQGAMQVIQAAQEEGLSLQEIYLDVLQEVMYEVGNLWHQNAITVDKEHYITSTTQLVLSQFYPLIFNKPRNGCRLLACTVGSELHEMGARMVSDLFEYNGWDSIYLGAAVPTPAILAAITEHHPDLIALSVTMPQHLRLCHETVFSIRRKFPQLKIAVGGRAFQTTDELWKKWDVDISTQDASQLVEWASDHIATAGGVRG